MTLTQTRRSDLEAVDASSTDGIIPAMGCGTYRMSSLECFRAIRRALAAGYRHVDTAMAYDNEAAVGRALSVSGVDRSEVFLTTKIKGYPEYLRYDRFLEAARGSLDRLGVDHLDLLLVHWWHPDGDMEETCAALDRLVDEGLVGHVGVSNFSTARLDRARSLLDAPLLTNQIEYHPYLARDELLTYCRNHDITVTAYSPLAEGRVVDDRTLDRIGARYGKSAAQVAIRWLVQQDGVVTIPKASTPDHQRENREVFDFTLSDAEMETIAALDGPIGYRLSRDGGPIQRLRHRLGRHVPASVRSALP